MIAIVDYGWGNIRAIANIYRRLNIAVSIAASANDLRGAHKVILPGVGAFDSAMQSLNESGMREPLEEVVIGAGKPSESAWACRCWRAGAMKASSAG